MFLRRKTQFGEVGRRWILVLWLGFLGRGVGRSLLFLDRLVEIGLKRSRERRWGSHSSGSVFCRRGGECRLRLGERVGEWRWEGWVPHFVE